MVAPYRFAAAGGGFGPTSYANTGGTGNRTGIITISHVLLTPGGAANFQFLIDGSQANTGYWGGFSGSGNEWLKIDLGTAKCIDAFKWYQSGATAQGTWRWEGSNDDSSYTQCGSDIALNGTTSGTEFTFAHSNGYRYYRLRFMSGTSSSGPYLREWEFKISA